MAKNRTQLLLSCVSVLPSGSVNFGQRPFLSFRQLDRFKKKVVNFSLLFLRQITSRVLLVQGALGLRGSRLF
jgi:hypothetical protein